MTRVELTDPSSATTATVAVVFVHLPHTGVTPGAFVDASGVVRHASVLAAGATAVEVDQLALGQHARSSWRVAFLRLAEPWYAVWRNRANMTWSIGPHRDSAEDALEQGAAELIYLGFAGR